MISVTGAVYGQSVTDSVNALQEHVPYQDMLGVTLQTASGILVQSNYFSRASIHIQKEQGNYRLPQQPEKETTINFATSGLRQLNKWKLYGQFNYMRTLLDSLPWDLRAQPESSHPYYFAAAKPGNWDNEFYTLSGIVSYQLMRNIEVGGASRYHTGDLSRSNDPRPASHHHQMDFEAFVGFKYKKLAISAGALYGYSSKSTDVIYGNEQENDRPTATDYITYEILGYGHYRPSEKYAKTFENKGSLYGANLQFSVQQKNGLIWARYQYRHHTDTILRQIDNYKGNYNLIGKYLFAENRLTIGSKHNMGLHRSIQTLLHVTSEEGRDAMWVKLQGLNNYVYSHTGINFTAALSNTAKRSGIHTYGFQLAYHNTSKKDGLAQHQLSHKQTSLDLYGAAIWPAGVKSQWLLRCAQGLTLRNAQLYVPEAYENIFTQYIAYPEEKYYSTNSGSTRIAAGIGTYFRKDRYATFLLTYTTMYALNDFKISRNQIEARISLNF